MGLGLGARDRGLVGHDGRFLFFFLKEEEGEVEVGRGKKLMGAMEKKRSPDGGRNRGKSAAVSGTDVLCPPFCSGKGLGLDGFRALEGEPGVTRERESEASRRREAMRPFAFCSLAFFVGMKPSLVLIPRFALLSPFFFWSVSRAK